MSTPPEMETKIKSALSALGVKVGDAVPPEIRWRIAWDIGQEMPNAWLTFYPAWFSVTTRSSSQTTRTA